MGLSDGVMNVHSKWLASSVLCCFPLQDQSSEAQGKAFASESATSSREPSALPVSSRMFPSLSTLNRTNVVVEGYNTTTVVDSQPQLQRPLILPSLHSDINRPGSSDNRRESRRASVWLGGGPEMASRAKSKARRLSTQSAVKSSQRRSASRRLMIGEPADFRRVCVSPVPRLSAFRPIQLSIYTPGNELPKLPIFSDDPEDDDDIPVVTEVPRPPQALMRVRSDTLPIRTVSNFSIPRKPLASRQSSVDVPKRSIDSEMTIAEPMWRPRTSSLYHMRPRRVGSANSLGSRSNQDFVEMLNAPLPPLPRLPVLNVTPTDPFAELTSSIVRRASDQSKRLQTHLQERELIDVRSPDCSTIAEERSPISPSSPMIAQPEPVFTPTNVPISEPVPQGLAITTPTLAQGIITTTQFTQSHDFITSTVPGAPAESRSVSAIPFASRSSEDNFHRYKSSSGSSTLINLDTATTTPEIATAMTCEALSKPIITTTVIALHEKPSVGQKLSQWLAKSKTVSKDSLRSTPDLFGSRQGIERSDSEMSDRSWFDNRDSGVFEAKDVVVGSNRGRSATIGTMSAFAPDDRDASLEVEKFPIPDTASLGIGAGVGVAM